MRRKTRFRLLFPGALTACLTAVVFTMSGLTQGELIAQHALTHLGAPYRFAASGPDKFDCSGFVLHCLAKEGFQVRHTAKSIGADGRYRQIPDIRQLMVGDVVCFDTVRDDDPSDHVGFYLGGGQFVHGRERVVLGSLEVVVHKVDLDGEVLILFVGLQAHLGLLELLYLLAQGLRVVFIALYAPCRILLTRLRRLKIGGYAGQPRRFKRLAPWKILEFRLKLPYAPIHFL